MTTTENLKLGRAKNAVLGFLQRKLSVPKIYLDANWAESKVDVLAIDSDGTGAVHAVLLFTSRYFAENGTPDIEGQAQAERSLMERFAKIPAHFKYIGAVEMNADRPGYSVLHKPSPYFITESFDPRGIGRIGFLTIDIDADGDIGVETDAKIRIKAERFKTAVAPLAIAYVREHEADWEVREWLSEESAAV